MLKKIIKAINILLIPVKIGFLGLICFYSYSYLNTVFINEEVDYGLGFHSLPEDSMDVIVLGSSHAQYSFNPAFFYQDTGLYAYVQGSPCQPLEVSYQMLKETLKSQSPKMVVLEVFTALPLRAICEADSAYILAQYQMRDEQKYTTIDFLAEEKAKTYYNEFLIHHNQWKEISELEQLKPSDALIEDYSKINRAFGYVYLPQTKGENSWYAETYRNDLDVQLEDQDIAALNDIYQLCKENNIELILYKTPIDGMDETNQSMLAQVWKWADEKAISYLDFFEKSKELDYQMWVHSDSFHAYINGAEMITQTLAESINEMNIFQHQPNDLLDELYGSKGINDIYAYAQIEKDIPRLFRRLENFEGEWMISVDAHTKLPEAIIASLNVMTDGRYDADQTNRIWLKQQKVQENVEEPEWLKDENLVGLSVVLFDSQEEHVVLNNLMD